MSTIRKTKILKSGLTITHVTKWKKWPTLKKEVVNLKSHATPTRIFDKYLTYMQRVNSGTSMRNAGRERASMKQFFSNDNRLLRISSTYCVIRHSVQESIRVRHIWFASVFGDDIVSTTTTDADAISRVFLLLLCNSFKGTVGLATF